jgi:hypothetical protein
LGFLARKNELSKREKIKEEVDKERSRRSVWKRDR